YGGAQAADSYTAGPGEHDVVSDKAINNTGITSVIKASGSDAEITFDSTDIVINWNGANNSYTSYAALRAENGGTIIINGGTVNTSNNNDSRLNNVRKQGLLAADGGTITASNLTINTTGGKSPGVQAYRD